MTGFNACSRPLLIVNLLLWVAQLSHGFQPVVRHSTALGSISSLQSRTTDSGNQEATVSNRRSFLSSGPLVAATVVSLIGASWVTAPVLAGAATSTTSVDYKGVAADIASLVESDPDKGPTVVRLAWHSSGTYDKMTQDGGSGGGTIRFKEELAHGGNAGLGDTAVKWMEPIYAKYSKQGLSYADLYTLGGGKVLNMCERVYPNCQNGA